jgi:C-terminal processing protease CtpA/Prc
MLKRATLVGEPTGGANHSGVLHNLDDHFAVGIPEHRPVNPFSDKDWAVTGVEPGVKVRAADALATAGKIAEVELRRRQSDRQPRSAGQAPQSGM